MSAYEERRGGMLLVVSGPAGVGKGTVDGEVLRRSPNMLLSVSATTRAPRPGEVDGVHYSFLTEEAFRRMIDENAFLEYVHLFQMNYYGTPRKFVEDNIREGRDVLLEIDVQGAMRVKETYPEAVLVFIAPPSMETLRQRLIGRGTETPEAIEKRFRTAFSEIMYMKHYDYIVLNDDLETAISRVMHIVDAEKCRCSRSMQLVKELTGGID